MSEDRGGGVVGAAEMCLERGAGGPGAGDGARSAEGRQRPSSSPPLGEGTVRSTSKHGVMASPPAAGAGAAVPGTWPLPASLDLLALDPAAREYFLSQQRQLSALEDQLRRLQATLQDQQQQQQWQQQRQQQQRQQQQQQPPIHVSVERPPLLSVSSSAAGPVLTVRAETLAAAATIQTQAEARRGQSLLLEAGSEEQVTVGEGKPSPVADARASTVEASTNTSFSLLLSDGASLRSSAAAIAAAAGDACAGATAGVGETAAGPAQPEPRDVRENHTQDSSQRRQADGADAATVSLSGCRGATPTPDHRDEVIASAAPGWTTQRGRSVEQERRQRERHLEGGSGRDRRRSGRGGDVVGAREDDGPGNAGSRSGGPEDGEDLEDELESPSLEGLFLRVPGDGDRRRHPASDDERASGTTQEEEEGEEDEEQREEEEEEEEEHQPAVVTPNHGSPSFLVAARRAREESGNGDGSFMRGAGAPVERVSWERPRGERLPSSARYTGRGAGAGLGGVPIIPIAELVVVPRIEFGQLTDDEMSSDLDEGEVRLLFPVKVICSLGSFLSLSLSLSRARLFVAVLRVALTR